LHYAKGLELSGQLAHVFFDECYVAFTDTSYREQSRVVDVAVFELPIYRINGHIDSRIRRRVTRVVIHRQCHNISKKHGPDGRSDIGLLTAKTRHRPL
jgi:hypothetical protein